MSDPGSDAARDMEAAAKRATTHANFVREASEVFFTSLRDQLKS